MPLLDDDQMSQFLADGYVVLRPRELAPDFHREMFRTASALYDEGRRAGGGSFPGRALMPTAAERREWAASSAAIHDAGLPVHQVHDLRVTICYDIEGENNVFEFQCICGYRWAYALPDLGGPASLRELIAALPKRDLLEVARDGSSSSGE